MRFRIPWAALVLAACAVVGTAQPNETKAQPPQIPQEVQAAWKKAGGKLDWYPKPGENSLLSRAENEPKDFPVFSFDGRRRESFAKLPAPEIPFGVDLYDTRANTTVFAELAALKNFQFLRLNESGLTDDGLKALAKAADLRALGLTVRGTRVTGAGLKELAALKDLQELTLDGGISGPQGIGLSGTGELAGLKNLRALKLQSLDTTNAAFKEIGSLKELRTIHLAQVHVTDVGLAELGKLPKLQSLQISGGEYSKNVTAEGFKGLAGATDLRELIFYDVPVTDEAGKHLAALKELRVLILYNSRVGDEGLKHLAGLTHLRWLTVSGRPSRITDAGVKHLASLKNLQSLTLRYAEITDEGAEVIAGMKSLRTLDLAATSITNAGLKHLAVLPELYYLDLQGNGAVTATGLKHLHGLNKLTTLALFGTKAYGTPERDKELDALRKVLPKCKIETANNYDAP